MHSHEENCFIVLSFILPYALILIKFGLVMLFIVNAIADEGLRFALSKIIFSEGRLRFYSKSFLKLLKDK